MPSNEYESLTTEFKREYTDDLKKNIVAFANTAGGKLYIGINDDGTVLGVDAPDDTMLKVSNMVRDSIKPDVTLFVEYEHCTMEGKPVIKISVQKGTAHPYYLTGRAYARKGCLSGKALPRFRLLRLPF
jgi:ATP-dependent DNA helicase RecG